MLDILKNYDKCSLTRTIIHHYFIIQFIKGGTSFLSIYKTLVYGSALHENLLKVEHTD